MSLLWVTDSITRRNIAICARSASSILKTSRAL
jgi:hypothetical protein